MIMSNTSCCAYFPLQQHSDTITHFLHNKRKQNVRTQCLKKVCSTMLPPRGTNRVRDSRLKILHGKLHSGLVGLSSVAFMGLAMSSVPVRGPGHCLGMLVGVSNICKGSKDGGKSKLKCDGNEIQEQGTFIGNAMP
jgi:hypothetical protein